MYWNITSFSSNLLASDTDTRYSDTVSKNVHSTQRYARQQSKNAYLVQKHANTFAIALLRCNWNSLSVQQTTTSLRLVNMRTMLATSVRG